METNINMVIERGENLEDLQQKTEELQVSGQQFNKAAKEVCFGIWGIRELRERACEFTDLDFGLGLVAWVHRHTRYDSRITCNPSVSETNFHSPLDFNLPETRSQKMWWEDTKMKIWIGIAVVCLLALIIGLAVGLSKK